MLSVLRGTAYEAEAILTLSEVSSADPDMQQALCPLPCHPTATPDSALTPGSHAEQCSQPMGNTDRTQAGLGQEPGVSASCHALLRVVVGSSGN